LTEAPCLGLRKVTRLIAAIASSARCAEGIDGQTVPARPWPDEKPAEGQGGREPLEPAAFVADLCDVSDRLDDERLAPGQVATVAWLHQKGAGRIVELIDRATRV
jgi:hypothetical protein